MPVSMETKGMVGELADTCILQARNDSAEVKQATVSVTRRALCPSHAAFATFIVDGDAIAANVDLNDSRMKLVSEVGAGGHAVLIVRLVELHNGTMCIRLGEIMFELELKPSV